MRYKIQIYGWFAAGVAYLAIGFWKSTPYDISSLVYCGVAALFSSVFIWYMTNRTDLVERLIAKSRKRNAQKQ